MRDDSADWRHWNWDPQTADSCLLPTGIKNNILAISDLCDVLVRRARPFHVKCFMCKGRASVLLPLVPALPPYPPIVCTQGTPIYRDRDNGWSIR